MGDVGVNVGYAQGSQAGSNNVRYRGDNAGVGAGGPLNQLLFEGLNNYMNSGALSDMLLGGRGFGQSRRYRQYNPYDPNYGYLVPPNQRAGGGGDAGSGDGSPKTPSQPSTGDTGGGTSGAGGEGGGADDFGRQKWEGSLLTEGAPGGGQPTYTENAPKHPNIGGGTPGPMGPGQWDNGGVDAADDEYGDDWYGDPNVGQGNQQNQYWGQNDDAPVEGEGLLGSIEGYGQWNDIDNRLKDNLGWQSTGDLMDLENRELGRWEDYGNPNALEGALGSDIANQRSGALSSLESEAGTGWRGLAGPGQYDPLRGDTLSGMVKNPGLSTSEKSSMLMSQTRPIQSALEAQRLEQDAREAASGNAAGRWGAGNAAALNAAGQAAQAGRNVETAAADYMRKDRAEGLSGLGSLQSQIDARKAQGTQGLQSLSQQQRSTQQAGINSGLNLNEQQRAAQAKSAEGVGDLGQRQRANTQWGLGALSDLNKEKTGQQLQQIGLTKDMWDAVNAKGQKEADRTAQVGSLVAGGQNESGQSGFNAGVSV